MGSAADGMEDTVTFNAEALSFTSQTQTPLTKSDIASLVIEVRDFRRSVNAHVQQLYDRAGFVIGWSIIGALCLYFVVTHVRLV
jgi:hypothetical protein